MPIIIQQDATEYSLFKYVNCSSCSGWFFIHHKELAVVNVAGLEHPSSHAHDR